MLQARLDLDLAHETVSQIRFVLQIREQNLHGLNPVRSQVAGLEHLTHAPGAQDRNDLVVSDSGSNFQAHNPLTAECAPNHPPWRGPIRYTYRSRTCHPLPLRPFRRPYLPRVWS